MIYSTNFDFSVPVGIKKTGNWILITKNIPLFIPIKPFSIFFGIPNPRKIKDLYVDELNTIAVEWNFNITTIYGDVTIRENEYSIISDENIKEYIGAVATGEYSLVLYNVNDNKLFNKKLQDSIFYIRSRGISYADALLMSMGLINKTNIFMLEPDISILYYFLNDNQVEYYLETLKNFDPEKLKNIKPIKNDIIKKEKIKRKTRKQMYVESYKEACTHLDLLVNEYLNNNGND